MTGRPVDADAWELSSGLVNDVDAWIKECRFGFKEVYRQKLAQVEGKVGTGLMCIMTLVDADGNELAEQGYSVGSDWEPSEDGMEIKNSKRDTIVKTSVYGQLLDQCLTKLKLEMWKYGSPLRADTWVGLGFHWNQVEHETRTAGEKRSALMPTLFLGVKEDIESLGEDTESSEQFSDVSEEMKDSLVSLAQSMTLANFCKAAVRVKGLSDHPEFMSHVIDKSDEGFWAQNHTTE